MTRIYSMIAALAALSAIAREVRVSSFGFDPEDSTRFIQAAIDSGAAKVIFDKMPSPWVALPLRGASKQELFFEPGAELVAKKGAFLDRNDVLMSFREAEDVKISGYGACIRMHKGDYMKKPYSTSEWRHALEFRSCRRVHVEGVAIRDSGGDAIYVGRMKGSKLRGCEDVVVRNVHCDGNNRQGISVISVRNLLVEGCRLNNTSGRPPEAGIDFEPNSPLDSLSGIVVRNCEMNGNKGDGIDLAFHQLRSSSSPVDILLENCSTDGNFRGLAFAQIMEGPNCVGGRVIVRNCVFKNAKYGGIDFYQKMPESAFVRFEGCRIENCCKGNPAYPDICFSTMKRTSAPPAEVDFGRLEIVTPVERNPLRYLYAGWSTQQVDSVKGTIVHSSPSGKREIVLDEAGLRAFSPAREPGAVHGYGDMSGAEVVDEAPGEMLELSKLNLRGRISYVFYAAKPGACRFSCEKIRLRKARIPTDKVVISPLGGGQEKIWPLAADSSDFSVSVPSAGFYRMSVPADRRSSFALTASDVPVGILLDDDNHQNICTTLGTFYFHVGEAAPFRLYISGSAFSERISARLHDPSGACVWKAKNVLFPETFDAKKASPGLWSVKTSHPSIGVAEDYYVDLTLAQPVLFLSAKRYWK